MISHFPARSAAFRPWRPWPWLRPSRWAPPGRSPERAAAPQAQAWIDVTTYSGMGMPAAGANPMPRWAACLAADQKNAFGNTQTGMAGRWVDVTLMSRTNPALCPRPSRRCRQVSGQSLKLQAPREVRGTVTDTPDDQVTAEHNVERPKGKAAAVLGLRRHGAGRPAEGAGHGHRVDGRPGRASSSRRPPSAARTATGRPVWPAPPTAAWCRRRPRWWARMRSRLGVIDGFRFQIPAAKT